MGHRIYTVADGNARPQIKHSIGDMDTGLTCFRKKVQKGTRDARAYLLKPKQDKTPLLMVEKKKYPYILTGTNIPGIKHKTQGYTLVAISTLVILRLWMSKIWTQKREKPKQCQGQSERKPTHKFLESKSVSVLSKCVGFWDDYHADGQTSEIRNALYACQYLQYHFIAADTSTARISSCQCLLSWKRSKK